MKKLLYCYLVFSFWAQYLVGQIPNLGYNFVMESTVKHPYKNLADIENKPIDSVTRFVRYLDRQGHVRQTVAWQLSPSKKDYITHYQRDTTGRMGISFLPYSVSNNQANYRLSAEAEQLSFYTTSSWNTNKIKETNHPYSVNKFHETLHHIVYESGSPGSIWQPISNNFINNNTVKQYTFLNDYEIPEDTTSIINNIVRYKVNSSSSGNTLAYVGYYAANTLVREVIWDENTKDTTQIGKQEVFKNKEGKTLVERVVVPVNGTPRMLSTYYVYDDYGNLAYILPADIYPDYLAPNVATLNKWCYQYIYNDHGLLIEERQPDIEPIYYVYNTRNQLVASQDPKQRAVHEWSVIKYDVLGRPVISGVWTNNNTAISRNDLQTQVTNHTVLFENRNTNTLTHGYTDNAWPASSTLSYNLVTYYDNYNIADLPVQLSYTTIPEKKRLEYPSRLSTANKTWTDNSERTVLWTVNYYDEHTQLIQSKAINHLGGIDQVVNYYNFVGKLTETERKHYDSNEILTLTIKNMYHYDHAGRLSAVKQKINNQDEVTQAAFTYNELGQLVDKKLHRLNGQGQYLQSIDYRYNERGWLTSINDADLNVTSAYNDGDTDSDSDLFGMYIAYHDDLQVPQYNGNIAATRWKTSQVQSQSVAPPKMGYQYRYDVLNRLTNTISEQNNAVNNAHDESMVYDVSGNITELQRKAYTGGNIETIDNLVYTYDGYRIKKIDDISTSSHKNLGYNDEAQLAEEHIYDANGNIVEDKNKGITLTYNDHNLVTKITFEGNPDHTLEFLYDCIGKKLQTKYSYPSGSYIIDYLDGIQYEQGQLSFIHTDEGRARRSGSTYIYEYDIKDHLGSVRVTFTPDPGDPTQTTPRVIQQNSYYAYGLPMYGDAANDLHLAYVSGEKSKFLYSGKELYDQGGLNWFDHGARFYDPALGRWSATDPATQFINPYLAMGNNPVIGVDPNGEFFIPILVGAGVGVLANGIRNTIQDQSFFSGWGMAAIMGGIGGYMSVASSSSMTVLQQAARATGSVASSYMNINVPIGESGVSIGIGPALFFGNGGAGLGYNVGVSYANENFAMGMSVGKTYWSNHVFTGGSFAETRFGYSAAIGSRDFKIGLGESHFSGGGIDQITGSINFIGKNWSVSYENDYIWGMGGDDGDRWRTTGLGVAVGDVSMKMHFATGDPGPPRNRPYDEDIHRGRDAYVPRSGSNPDQFRLGSAAIGYRGIFGGWNSESIRHIGQNRIAHDIGTGGTSKHFRIMPNAPHQGFYYGMRLNNYNTTW